MFSMPSTTLVCDTEPWKDLKGHVKEIEKTHLHDLMNDVERCKSMMVEFDGILLDYSRQRVRQDTVEKLFKLAEEAHLKQKMDRMYGGERINSTENRSVLHIALRAPRDKVVCSDGKNVVPDVWTVLDKIKDFSERVRSGSWVGATGKVLKDVVAIGIGGSFLGPLFVHTALQTDPEAGESAKGRQLRFLANVDPIDVARNITGLNPETTLVVVVSKTFTTAETMLNARTLKEWIQASLGPQAVAKHMVAVSTNIPLVKEFGIDPANAFAFWDWVGGRYSVCSAVGVLPLSLQYGFPIVQKFLNGASSIDNHFYSTSFEKNIPVLLGLLSVWNVSFLGYPARVSMESNGKGVSIDGIPLPFEAGEIDFGEPGTNGQHSFYQLIHQVPVKPPPWFYLNMVATELKGQEWNEHGLWKLWEIKFGNDCVALPEVFHLGFFSMQLLVDASMLVPNVPMRGSVMLTNEVHLFSLVCIQFANLSKIVMIFYFEIDLPSISFKTFQGRVIPCDFIGIVKSQQPIYLKGEAVSNHDELMSNFFAQPDALAYGKTREQLLGEKVPNHLIPHKTFSGNRPSLSLLLPSLSAYNIGQLLAIYEHRIAVEGFIWGINSFDQWGVELGKSLATQVRKQLNLSRTKGEPVMGFNFSTSTLLTRYLELLAIYEHRIAVEGFIWGINSFDQWGVELGKSLATQVRKQLNLSRTKGEPVMGFNFSTSTLLTRYLEGDSGVQSDSTMLPKM
ncbi:putative glucose-6-phosphate isomerase, cytosolic 1 [Cocos nucifera]|uniref:Glucose-6-phosphate isomerase n=1 Tax=Cocos nucifera TaxID=13894 RepID=A0A8K0IDL1_COCNU|nr:putative glucose-6-phosphate isomerase, cytosolic 1 [Cocos nucifera]